MKKFMLVLLYISGIITSITAQTGKLFSTDNELSNSLINTIFQDSHNFIWVATEDGLNKYVGVKFMTYRNVKNISTKLFANIKKI